ncbi:hypothetical protein CCMSSC00406_0003314 [Pleurotus cornucopiae]|uniref:Uncharacterized protein n=1 Tax=Pleurotus cornucopiae TaxID=5321 RepID=A0ACB7J858_PLECO|nr:hypothetical protein CCMSSC00406_0003314 [Pleurotus cornucopiae]
MAQSSLLDSFDPFATHPFTNISGVIPQPPAPSRYAIPQRPRASTSQTSSAASSPSSSQGSSPTLQSPQPRPFASSPPQPVFVPFRQESSSPDLVLKKKGLRY